MNISPFSNMGGQLRWNSSSLFILSRLPTLVSPFLSITSSILVVWTLLTFTLPNTNFNGVRGILLFRGCVLPSPNSDSKDTTKPTKNATRTATTKHYDWALINNRGIRDKYVLELRNRFETFQEKIEIRTPNDEYENFVSAHLEAAVKCIPTKPRTKYRVPWETLAVREKRAHVKTATKNYRKDPTNTNAIKLKNSQYQLTGIYLKEQREYIQNQIDKIRNSVEDRQSRIAW